MQQTINSIVTSETCSRVRHISEWQGACVNHIVAATSTLPTKPSYLNRGSGMIVTTATATSSRLNIAIPTQLNFKQQTHCWWYTCREPKCTLSAALHMHILSTIDMSMKWWLLCVNEPSGNNHCRQCFTVNSKAISWCWKYLKSTVKSHSCNKCKICQKSADQTDIATQWCWVPIEAGGEAIREANTL